MIVHVTVLLSNQNNKIHLNEKKKKKKGEKKIPLFRLIDPPHTFSLPFLCFWFRWFSFSSVQLACYWFSIVSEETRFHCARWMSVNKFIGNIQQLDVNSSHEFVSDLLFRWYIVAGCFFLFLSLYFFIPLFFYRYFFFIV